jgi:transcriptional regulator with XRE-family HTH domain
MTLAGSNPDLENTPRGKLIKHLRLARQAAGFTTLPPLAKKMGVSPDLLSKIETGKYVPHLDTLNAWLDACNVSEELRGFITDFWACARTATADGIKDFFEKYFQAEQRAAFLRMWALLLIPGPLQTREYAQAIFLKGGMEAEEAAEQLDLRMKRQERVSGPEAAHATVLIFEPVLHLLVGSPEIMVTQLEYLLELSDRRNVILQVVPHPGEYFPGLDGEFSVASGPTIPDTVVTVTVMDNVSDHPDSAAKVIALFEETRSYARSAVESRALMTEALEQWKSRLQQQ